MGKAPQLLIKLLIDLTNRTRAKTVPAELPLIALTFGVDTP